MIRISNDPHLSFDGSPLIRYIENLKKIEEIQEKRLLVYVKLHYFTENDKGEEEEYFKIEKKDFVLIASNNSRVDLSTGGFATPETKEADNVGEYDYIRTQKGLSMEELEIGGILRADSLGFFNS